jgi:methionyl aminopeptidase
MRAAGAAAAELLAFAGTLVVPGATSDDIDARFHERCCAAGWYPSPLGYAGFPKSICVSVNEVVCHGVPDSNAVIRAGDLVSLDVSVYGGGVHGDNCRTFVAGGVAATDDEGRRLLRAARACLAAGVAAAGPGVCVARVGDAVQAVLDAAGFAAVRAYAGHGIGAHLHTRPLVWHHGNSGSADVLRPGMTFTIEPMVVTGGVGIEVWPEDGWTVVTADGGRAAQFEHMLLVTEHGVDVLTAHEEEEQGDR